MANVVIVGSGPAAHLAALVFHQAGWSANLIGPMAQANPHVHVLRPTLLEEATEIDPDLADELRAQLDPNWNWRDVKTTRIAPRLSREALCGVLVRQVEARNILRSDRRAAQLNEFDDYDLVLDATGTSRVLLRATQDHDVELHHIGNGDNYATWLFKSETVAKQTVHLSNPHAYIEQDETDVRVSIIQSADAAPINLEQIKKWLDTYITGSCKLMRPKPVRHIGSELRYVTIEPVSEKASSLIPFGDALVETCPRTGFGLTSVFKQGVILKNSLSKDPSGASVIKDLAAYARGLWLGGALQSALLD